MERALEEETMHRMDTDVIQPQEPAFADVFADAVLAVALPGDVEHLSDIGLKANLYGTKGQ